MEELIFYADKIMVMGNSKNSRVFNFVTLLKLRKFDARKIYVFYSGWEFLLFIVVCLVVSVSAN